MTKNVFNSISHASNKRTTALSECDYDHEIHLIDHTNGPLSRHQSLDETRSRTDLALDQESTRGTSGDRRHSVDGDYENRRQRGKRHKVKKEVEKKRWSKKWTEDRPAERAGQVVVTALDSENSPDITPTTSGTLPVLTTTPPNEDSSGDERGRSVSKRQSINTLKFHKAKHTDCEEVIDILYENERGGFLCGIPLFSGKALGALDHAPWTNIAFKPSATNIHDAQPPDPEWEWAWPEWRVNHDPEAPKQDADGWEYSFMFSKRCSWHGPTWYNSFVRRRAWIRKRVKVHHKGMSNEEGHQLTADYFTIHSQRMRSLSPAGTRQGQPLNANGTEFQKEDVVDRSDIRDINHLMAALRESRIDREKIEVIESFVLNGGDDLLYLGKRMKDVMGMFIFQASRRTLLAHLSKTLDDAIDERKRKKDALVEGGMLSGEEEKAVEERTDTRISNLMVAIRAADAEVKRLEYWSDIKEIAEEGATKGAVDEDKGWGEEWTGLDFSGPKAVITEANQPGGDDELAERHEDEYYGARDDEEQSPGEVKKDKGKGKGKEVRF